MSDVRTDLIKPTEPNLLQYRQADSIDGLADILVASLDVLAKAGQIDAACRLAGRACAQLRDVDARQWQKFNALLHRLSKQERWDEP
ncbi:hypothetical protein [Mesorhizobium huakuii]|uniref:Uncharacterized protein n=1 Tax=Mesorhizobium huakuii TaxID=28104 RepID=A0ABZ0VQ64_9HYPH|nr:hypothetical protein [Mesorhizobium huakuii]WQB99607.1 hypothetical protein U0R22_003792 [Mesorhizobium huakuii]